MHTDYCDLHLRFIEQTDLFAGIRGGKSSIAGTDPASFHMYCFKQLDEMRRGGKGKHYADVSSGIRRSSAQTARSWMNLYLVNLPAQMLRIMDRASKTPAVSQTFV